jgi:uncharacterized membrane protein (UPF0136 family)
MSGFFSFGRKFSRDCFFCLGGLLVFIAIADVIGNSPASIRFGDWSVPDSEFRDVLSLTAYCITFGSVFLVAAYALFKERRWGAHFAAVVSGLALPFVLVFWSGERLVVSFYGLPLLFTLIWAIAEVARESKERRTFIGAEVRRD